MPERQLRVLQLMLELKVGDIKNASQGQFSIGSPISDYESESSLKKKIRVVSQVIFYLE